MSSAIPTYGHCITLPTSTWVFTTLTYLTQIKKRDEEIAQLQEEGAELKDHYKAVREKADTAERAREALQSECDQIVEELKSREEAMISMEGKMEEEEEKRGEELARCERIIEELKQRLRESELQQGQQLLKVKVVTSTNL